MSETKSTDVFNVKSGGVHICSHITLLYGKNIQCTSLIADRLLTIKTATAKYEFTGLGKKATRADECSLLVMVMENFGFSRESLPGSFYALALKK